MLMRTMASFMSVENVANKIAAPRKLGSAAVGKQEEHLDLHDRRFFHCFFLHSSRRSPIPPLFLVFGCLFLLLLPALFKAEHLPENKSEKMFDEPQHQQGSHHHYVTKDDSDLVKKRVEVEDGVVETEQACTIRVQVVKKVAGKCIRLRDGNMGCLTDDYLDPVNDGCW